MVARNALRLVVALLLVVSLGQLTSAQRGGGWQYLGEANVDGNNDHDRIQVGRSEGRFRALQIRVERAPIEFQRVLVHYNNGADEELQFRDRIKAGGKTRALDLRGSDRVVQSVELWYARGRYGSAKPKLRLYGR